MKSLILLALITSHSLFAQTRGDQLNALRTLSNAIESETYITRAPQANLSQAILKLQEAYQLLGQTNPPTDPQTYKQCVAWSTQIYSREMNNGDALDRAQRFCANVADFNVAQFLYSKHYRDLSSTQAMDLALSQSTYDIAGKIDLIEFAFDKHYRDMSTSPAATKARDNAAIINRNTRSGLTCFQKYFQVYYRDNSSSIAMEKTALSCSRQP
ncbi:MAG: hypothetical protein COW00_10490 [Bdellovibrio sp. CG12_big_fil_rev_8_21_14_0_65_39_13]|nr:MAG: hypothetical protein COW78_00825 [Bdellovibrio sp. CG22_combo_CG10-13_8_21_14_all_39_27]PIQ59537.1 MAG: hypothetical protein COW00_10490 [Bdellovibrio sp. CG12_big_fil_rev_8_21_14_0_65_39_13]PIR33457.1 MAG: hypothetical protein COV37_15995 [Bdellovibrio sp. CG11_big_fil_rev_8_21_14_0_20_39_38]